MSQKAGSFADEVIRFVTINKSVINALGEGYILFKSHQGRLVDVVSHESLSISKGVQLTPLRLKVDEIE